MGKIFISYSKGDADEARGLSSYLSDSFGRRHEVFLDRKIISGADWERQLNEELRDTDVVVCLVTPSFARSKWCVAEVAVARTWGKRIMPLAAGANPTRIPMLLSLNYIKYVADREAGREDLRSQLQAFLEAGWEQPRSGPRPPPFPGPAPFDRDRSWAFCGRGEEILEFVERLRSPVTAAAGELRVVVGPPGCGKSSFVRAGVLPMWLGEAGRWALPTVVPGERPLKALAGAFAEEGRQLGLSWTPEGVASRLALAASANSANGATEGTDTSEASTTAGAGEPQALVADMLAAAPEGFRRRLLIVLDRFEGVLTRATPEDRSQFAQLLRALLACPVRIVATLRSEFVPAMEELAGLHGVPFDLFTLRPVDTEAALREIIIEPARRAGVITVDPPLVDALIRDTQDGNALPLLAYILGQLAEGVRAGGALSMQRYSAMGGVDGALKGLADSALAARQKAGRQPSEALASLLRLVAFDSDGKPVGKDLDGAGLPEEVTADLDAFVDRHVLTTRTGHNYAKIFTVRHRRFLTAWPPLKEKLEQEREAQRERDALADAALVWDQAGRPKENLWHPERIARATRPGPSGVSRPLSDLERDFEAAYATHAAKRAEQRRRVIAAMAIALAVVFALSGLTAWQWSVASQERNNAVERELLALADGLLESDPRLAIQIALAANDISDDDDTQAGLHNAMVGTGYLGSFDQEGALRAVAFSPDGGKIAFGGDNGDVVIAGIPRPGKAGERRTLLEGHEGAVNAVAFSPDSRVLVTAGDDGKIFSWDLTGPGQPPRDLLGDQKAAVNAIALSRDGRTLATAGEDGRVILWHTDTSNPGQAVVPEPLGEPANAVAFAPDGRTLAVGIGNRTGDGTVILWDTFDRDRPGERRTLHGHTRVVTAVAFQRDGLRLATGDAGGTVMVWDTSTSSQPGGPVEVLSPPATEYAGAVTGLVYTDDGKLVTAGQKQAVLVRHAADPKAVLGTPISDRGSPALGVAAVTAVTLDGKTVLAVASQNGSVLVWSLAPEGQPRIFGDPIPAAPTTDMLYIDDGSALFAAGGDNSLRIWNVAHPARPRTLGPRIDLEGFGGVLETADAGDECGLPSAVGRSRPEVEVAGCRLAIAGTEGRVKIFDIADPRIFDVRNPRSPEQIADYAAHPGIPIHDMQFSNDGSLLVTGAENGEVHMWDTADRQSALRRVGDPLPGHTGAVRDVQFDMKGLNLLATASDDGTVILWDVADPRNPRLVGDFDDPGGPVNDVTFSKDGRTLFAASDDGNVWGWDVSDLGEPASLDRPLPGHRGPVYDLTNIGDRIIATSGEDGKVNFWDVSEVRRPRQLGPVITYSAAIIDMNAAGDVNRLATTSEDRTIRLWDMAPLLSGIPNNLVELACARVGGGLSEEDWETYIPDTPYRQTCR